MYVPKNLRDLASLNKVPQYGKDGKLYSTFSRIRRPIRRHITFRGEPLVEVSDILYGGWLSYFLVSPIHIFVWK